MSELVAGVDSSTQSCKVVVCDAETGEVVRLGRAAHPDGTEVDPARWWAAYEEASAGGLLDGVAGIAVGGQQHGMVTLDGSDEVVRPALLWNDTRSARAAADLVRELGGPEAWVKAVGVVPVASITVAKLRWLARAEPASLARTRACVLPHDWVTGQILKHGNAFDGWTTDRSDASGTGYWSAGSEAYQPDLLELAIGSQIEVPRVVAPSGVAGRTSDGLLVAAGAGDNAGAALGLGIAHGDVVVSVGTSGVATTRHHSAVADPSGEVASFADAEGGHLPLVCTLNGARVLGAAASILGTDLAGVDRLALAAPAGASGLTLLPFLDGERTPNLPAATGTLSGLTRANATPENLARAHVEGLLLSLAAGLDGLRRVGAHIERVLLIGGASVSAAVRALAPDLFGVQVVVPAPGEYVGIGAARQAAWALSGGAEPPTWSVRTEMELDPADLDAGAETKARYADLLHRVHGL